MAHEDRLSQLPELVLTQIFFLLHLSGAARMTVVSKTWRDMWAAFPVFDFNFDQMRLPVSLCREMDTKKFLNSIDKGLVSIQPGMAIIKKFRLCMSFRDPNIASRIDSWIELVTKNFVGELDIEIKIGRRMENLWYSIPIATFLAKTVEVLCLRGCKLEQPVFVDTGKHFYLRKVSLVKVWLDDKALWHFLNLCRALEDLSIIKCKGLNSLLIPSLPRLERLTFTPDDSDYVNAFRRVDIKATYLQFFCYQGWSHRGIVHILDICVAAYTRLREVNIEGAEIMDDVLEAFLSKLPLLQKMTLTRCSGIQRIKISHHLLRTLSLGFHSGGLVQLEMETPNLVYFKYGANHPPEVFTLSAPNLQESYIELHPHDGVCTLWFLNLRRCLSNFKRLNGLSLRFVRSRTFLVKNTFSPDTLNECEVPPFPVVEHLTLQSTGVIASSDAVLDGLLWSCHPDSVLFACYDTKFLRAMCETLLVRLEEPLCCEFSLTKFKCWRYWVKDVINERLTVMEDRDAFLNSLSTSTSEVRFQLKWCLVDK